MLAPFKIILGNPNLRLACLSLILIGSAISSVMPFQSVIAVEVLGFSDAGYAVVLALDAILAVAASVYVGVLTDSRSDRRTLAIWATVIAVIASALMWLAPSIFTFFLVHAILYPLGGTVFSQTFALTRLASADLPKDERDAVLSAVRACLALPFIVVLPIWSAVLSNEDVPLLVVYPVILILHLTLLLLIWQSWPSDKTAGWSTAKSSLSLWAGLREMAQPAVLIRVFAMGAIISGTPIYMATLGLAFEAVTERSRSDTAIFFGLVAGLEVPVMLLMGTFLRWMRRRYLIALGAVMYGAFLILLPVLIASPLVWLLTLLAGFGGGIILSLPISYLQDLLAERPGAGGSLMAVQRVISNGIAAVIFALGTWVGGYGFTAALSGFGMVLAAAYYLWLDREGRPIV